MAAPGTAMAARPLGTRSLHRLPFERYKAGFAPLSLNGGHPAEPDPVSFNRRLVTIGGGAYDLDDGGATGLHAHVLRLRGSFAVEPVAPAVPVTINGWRTPGIAALHDGDVLAIGASTYRFTIQPLAADDAPVADDTAPQAVAAGGQAESGERPTFWQFLYGAVNWAFLRPKGAPGYCRRVAEPPRRHALFRSQRPRERRIYPPVGART